MSKLILTAALKVTKIVGIAFIIAIIVILAVIFILRTIHANQFKTKSENGVQENLFLELGGIEQYVKIQGEDTSNPVILFLHGGPGYPMAYLNYYYQPSLLSDFTIVSWDQRGSGRTYYQNPDMNIDENLSKEQLLRDLSELVEYLKNRFSKEKIIIMGHSWGTILGTLYINQHPDNVLAYVGVGQIIDFSKGKVMAAEKAKQIANEKGQKTDVEILNKTANVFSETKKLENMDYQNTVDMILTSLKYLTCEGEMAGLENMWTGLVSPDMSWNDIRWFFKASDFEKISMLQAPLVQYMYFDFDIHSEIDAYEVPVYYICGQCDWITPTVMVEAYQESMEAPKTELIIIENAGHVPFLDQPKTFSQAVKYLLGDD